MVGLNTANDGLLALNRRITETALPSQTTGTTLPNLTAVDKIHLFTIFALSGKGLFVVGFDYIGGKSDRALNSNLAAKGRGHTNAVLICCLRFIHCSIGTSD